MAKLKKDSTVSTPVAGELYTPTELASRLKVPEATLTDWRFRRRGPAYIKLNRLVRYPADAVEAWLAERMQAAAQ